MAVTAQEMLDKYMQAEADVLAGKTVVWAGRTMSMENLKEIRAGRQEWERRVAQQQANASGGGRSYSLAEFS